MRFNLSKKPSCIFGSRRAFSSRLTRFAMNHKQRTHLLEEALTLHQSQQHEEAERLYAKVRRECPKDFDAWFLSGAMAFQRGDHLDHAIELLSRARKIQPLSPECRLFLGMALADAKRFSDAEPHLSWVLKRLPNQPEAWENLANSQKATGKPREALNSLQKMTEAAPRNPLAFELLGELTASLKGFPEAEIHFRKAVELDPNFAIAWSNLGLSLIEQSGQIAEGMDCFDKALQLDPFLSAASASRALGLMRLYKLEESMDLHNSILWMEPANARVMSARNMILNYLPGQSRDTIFAAHKEFGTLFENESSSAFINTPNPKKKLRVGFVSADFRSHSVAYFIEPIFKNLDPEKYELILYHCHHSEDSRTTDFRKIAKRWRNLSGLENEAAEALIRSDAPDILIDLAGHSAMNRLALFAKRLAPVQITYLGYPNTTGLSTMDYRLVDEITDPVGPSDLLATEKLLRFSTCAWVYEPPANAPEPSLAEFPHPITFGSFNNFLKVTDEVLLTWARLLQKVPGSRLLVKSLYLDDEEVRRSVFEKIANTDIEQDRFELRGFTPSVEDHLATYTEVDVALDCFPYNGTTTTCEALWMGVPVVSLAGDRHASRVGLSILSAVGNTEWAAKDTEEYINIAVNLASDTTQLHNLRQTLRSNVQSSILLKQADQTRRFEKAIDEAWTYWFQKTQA